MTDEDIEALRSDIDLQEIIREEAEAGNAESQCLFGAFLLAENNLSEAKFWLDKAVKQGFYEAQSKFQLCIEKERGLKETAEKGIKTVTENNQETRQNPSDIKMNILDELEENLKLIKHLSSEEQFKIFVDEKLSTFEKMAIETETQISKEFTESFIMENFEKSLIRFPLEQTKTMFMSLIADYVNQRKWMNEYISRLQREFPSSSRISVLAKRYDAIQMYFKTLMQKITNYKPK